MWAAQGGHLAVCRYLQSASVAFETINANGQGCLHKAAQRGHADVARWLVGPEVGLLREDRNVDARLHRQANKSEGARPSNLARSGGHDELAKWLEVEEVAGDD